MYILCSICNFTVVIAVKFISLGENTEASGSTSHRLSSEVLGNCFCDFQGFDLQKSSKVLGNCFVIFILKKIVAAIWPARSSCD